MKATSCGLSVAVIRMYETALLGKRIARLADSIHVTDTLSRIQRL